ncbi:hypothetical protein [Methylobacterium nodulans]|uniref:Uncharacterized protein n=1 Tax=Methylobacterium nodulans (strain LMG 21967 / CNCM I-2342 / ORS 2060) TaxID=460265 RepID=B8IH49_METNO|nr:hypothetical protein [Methylobacterium nodulans]ACL59741.1 hypothetical protein Mnod_4882 [Methylobacterium nodulans ORS 2060]
MRTHRIYEIKKNLYFKYENWLKTHYNEINIEFDLIRESGLVDVNYYFMEGQDVLKAGVDPVEHFCRYGWREGRRPNLCFDPCWYRGRYLAGRPDVNPLAHYIAIGEAAGFRPIAYFNPAWYRQIYAIPPDCGCLKHYLDHRRSQRFAPNALFDIRFYLDRHGHEIGANRDPFAHLLRLGATRDLDPSRVFDSAAYRAQFMGAVDAEPIDLSGHERKVPLVHFLDALVRPLPVACW